MIGGYLVPEAQQDFAWRVRDHVREWKRLAEELHPRVATLSLEEIAHALEYLWAIELELGRATTLRERRLVGGWLLQGKALLAKSRLNG